MRYLEVEVVSEGREQRRSPADCTRVNVFDQNCAGGTTVSSPELGSIVFVGGLLWVKPFLFL